MRSIISEKNVSLVAVTLAAILTPLHPAGAQCPVINFDDLAVGTAVTNQYQGVTFSVVPQSCGASAPVYMRIYRPTGGTSSGLNCIRTDVGCPDFSPDYLSMVFDLPQSYVSFVLGDSAGTFRVRSYSTATGGTALATQTITIPGSGAAGVHRLVTVQNSSAVIRRIEVEETVGSFEAIDDLTFTSDTTPPVAAIQAPVAGTSLCASSILIRGQTCDPDGAYESDTLYYMPLGGTNWTQVGTATTPVCTPNSMLYFWSTTSLPDGGYFLRIEARNKCGLTSEAVTMVYLDRSISATLDAPADGAILGGSVSVAGSVNDPCFGSYTVKAASVSAPTTFAAVDPAHASYTTTVTNGTLAAWNTPAWSDGDYFLRVTALNYCAGGSYVQTQVTVDNTPPAALLTAPVPCSARGGLIEVRGTAGDAHLQSWVVQYTGGDSHGWVTIASGTSSVVNGLLAVWNTASLPPCAYTLRLVVTDQAVRDSNPASHNQSEFLTDLNIVSDSLAQDTDGDGMPDVWELAYDLDPKDAADAALDADKDGQSNLAEYRAGTNPRDPKSLLRITALSRQDKDAVVSWTTVGSHHYLLQGGTSISGDLTSSYSPLISIPPGGASTNTYRHTNGATSQSLFYRVRLVD